MEPTNRGRAAASCVADMGWARRRARLPGAAALVVDVPGSTFALTFDDGPDAEGTPRVLDALDRTTAPGTFFVLTDRVASTPQLVEEILARGHGLGLHGDRHERLDRIGVRLLARRLGDARARLEDIGGVAVTLFRPPFGRASWRTFLAASRAGLDLVLWSHDPRDWEQGVASRIDACLAPGAVVLLHDGCVDYPAGADATAEALVSAVPAARDAGLSPIALCGARSHSR